MPIPPGPGALSKKLANEANTAGLSSRTPAGAQRPAPPSSVAHAGAPSQPSAGSCPNMHTVSGGADSVAPHAS